MTTRWLTLTALPVLLFHLAPAPAWAQPGRSDSKDKAAVAKNAEAFVEAFQKADAKALAAYWTPDGDFTDQEGKHLKGREAIEKAFAALFAENKGLKLHIHSQSLRFVTPSVAIEDGVTAVISPEA